jgi:hypothetical protein
MGRVPISKNFKDYDSKWDMKEVASRWGFYTATPWGAVCVPCLLQFMAVPRPGRPPTGVKNPGTDYSILLQHAVAKHSTGGAKYPRGEAAAFGRYLQEQIDELRRSTRATEPVSAATADVVVAAGGARPDESATSAPLLVEERQHGQATNWGLERSERVVVTGVGAALETPVGDVHEVEVDRGYGPDGDKDDGLNMNSALTDQVDNGVSGEADKEDTDADSAEPPSGLGKKEHGSADQDFYDRNEGQEYSPRQKYASAGGGGNDSDENNDDDESSSDDSDVQLGAKACRPVKEHKFTRVRDSDGNDSTYQRKKKFKTKNTESDRRRKDTPKSATRYLCEERRKQYKHESDVVTRVWNDTEEEMERLSTLTHCRTLTRCSLQYTTLVPHPRTQPPPLTSP